MSARCSRSSVVHASSASMRFPGAAGTPTMVRCSRGQAPRDCSDPRPMKDFSVQSTWPYLRFVRMQWHKRLLGLAQHVADSVLAFTADTACLAVLWHAVSPAASFELLCALPMPHARVKEKGHALIMKGMRQGLLPTANAQASACKTNRLSSTCRPASPLWSPPQLIPRSSGSAPASAWGRSTTRCGSRASAPCRAESAPPWARAATF